MLWTEALGSFLVDTHWSQKEESREERPRGPVFWSDVLNNLDEDE